MSRKSIAETMAFALDHSDCASEVMFGVPTVQLTMNAGDWRDNRLSYFKADISCYEGAPSCPELRASRIGNRVELLVMTY